jgi:hypothetical protein
MSVSGVLEQIQGLGFGSDAGSDSGRAPSLFDRFSQRYSVAIRSEADLFRFVDSLAAAGPPGPPGRLQRENAALLAGKAAAERAFAGAEALLESQLADTRRLSEQRGLLVEKLAALDLACRRADGLVQALSAQLAARPPAGNPAPAPVPAKARADSPREPASDCVYSILSGAFRACEGALPPEELPALERIRDDSDRTPADRIVAMARCCCDAQRRAGERLAAAAGEGERLAAENAKLRRECAEVLRVFEGELAFLQQLCHSKSLQNVVFYRTAVAPSLALDRDQREELVRRCASIGGFIDQHLGALSESDVALQLPHAADAAQIFALTGGESAEAAIRKLLLQFDETESIQARKVLDLLIAQVIMNEVLRRQIAEQRSLLRSDAPPQAVSPAAAQTADFARSVARYKKRVLSYKARIEKIRALTQGQDPIAYIRGLQQTVEATKSRATAAEDQRATHIEQLLASARQEVALLTQGNAALKKQVQDEAVGQQSEIAARDRQILKLQKRLSRFQAGVTEYESQLRTVQTELEMSLSGARAIQEKNADLKNDNEKLKEKIANLEELNLKGIQEIKTKSAGLRTQYETTLAQMAQLKQQNQKFAAENEQKDRELCEIRAELERERIQHKSALLKIKSTEERLEVDRKTLVSQIAARQTSHDTDLDRVSKAAEEKLRVLSANIIAAIARFSGSLDVPSDALTAVEAFGSQFSDLRKVQSLYSHQMGEMDELRRFLRLDRVDLIVPTVRGLVAESDTRKAEMQKQKERAEKQRQERDQFARESARVQAQAAAAKQWETWATRLVRVIRDGFGRSLTADQLRLTLEESLLASVTNRVMFFRLELLRDEKRILARYGKAILIEKSKRAPVWHAIVISVLFIRRVQRMSGNAPVFFEP